MSGRCLWAKSRPTVGLPPARAQGRAYYVGKGDFDCKFQISDRERSVRAWLPLFSLATARFGLPDALLRCRSDRFLLVLRVCSLQPRLKVFPRHDRRILGGPVGRHARRQWLCRRTGV